jgi:hypothetical protein
MTFAGSIASTMAHYALPYALQNTSLASYTTVQYFNKLSVPTVTGSIYYAYIVRSISTSSANVFVSVNDVLKKNVYLVLVHFQENCPSMNPLIKVILYQYVSLVAMHLMFNI